jgi:uncharacterized protein
MPDYPECSFELTLLPERFMVCRLPAGSEVPDWAQSGDLSAIVRTPEEMSIVCSECIIPDNVIAECGWRVLKVEGPLEFSMVGVLASLALPLSQAGVSIFVLSTYDTDYLMVKEDALSTALISLCEAGHIILDDG